MRKRLIAIGLMSGLLVTTFASAQMGMGPGMGPGMMGYGPVVCRCYDTATPS